MAGEGGTPTPGDRSGNPDRERPGAGTLIGLLTAAPAELTDGEVTDGLLDLVELSGRVHAALARFTASFDARSLATVDGARSVSGWVAARSELSRAAAVGALACGRALRHCPVVDAAATAGRLGTAKVRLLLDARVDLEDHFAAHEADLVERVAPLTVEQARRWLDAWRDVALATAGKDGPTPGDDSDRNNIHLSSTYQNRWRIDGDLDRATGDEVANHLDTWIDRAIRDGVLDPTTLKRSQMRAKALAALLGVGAHAKTPRTQARADIRLTWDAADLLGQPVADLAQLAHRRCLTDRGTHLSRFAASEALCNADVHDLLVHFGLDGTRTVLGATHTRRHPTNRERAALDERDRGCVFPGCDAPVNWCDAHHTTPYEIGHRTQLDELVLLCPHHHRQVHRGFTLTRTTTGHIQVTRPDGTRLDPHGTHDDTGPDDTSPVDPRHKLPPPTRFTAPIARPRPDRYGHAA